MFLFPSHLDKIVLFEGNTRWRPFCEKLVKSRNNVNNKVKNHNTEHSIYIYKNLMLIFCIILK